MYPHTTKVVVTGLGMMTALGRNVSDTWTQLIQGKDGVSPMSRFDVSNCRCKTAAMVDVPEVDEFPNRSRISSKLLRTSRLAIPAVREALEQAQLLDDEGSSKLARIPMSISTTGGGMTYGESFLRHCLSKSRKGGQLLKASRYQPQAQVLDIQEYFNIRGPVTIIANACASGANALGHAADLIRMGRSSCVLAGGYDEMSELIYVGFDCLQALTQERCRPFDQNRSGLVLGEASGFLILESEEHAKQRGAPILCELRGYGHSTDLHHLTQPEPSGKALTQAIHHALERAGLSKESIGYINAHGTGTRLNDTSECCAFAPFLENSNDTRWSSTKSAIGHTLGAAGAVEAIFAIQALRSGELPPQINLQQPEPAAQGRLAKPGERNNKLQAVLSTNLGFGGSNAALIFSRYDS
jgi:3-oxoacyl-[acyl-carrier-protein] synthase II